MKYLKQISHKLMEMMVKIVIVVIILFSHKIKHTKLEKSLFYTFVDCMKNNDYSTITNNIYYFLMFMIVISIIIDVILVLFGIIADVYKFFIVKEEQNLNDNSESITTYKKEFKKEMGRYRNLPPVFILFVAVFILLLFFSFFDIKSIGILQTNEQQKEYIDDDKTKILVTNEEQTNE